MIYNQLANERGVTATAALVAETRAKKIAMVPTLEQGLCKNIRDGGRVVTVPTRRWSRDVHDNEFGK